jgi:hypothetical protein
MAGHPAPETSLQSSRISLCSAEASRDDHEIGPSLIGHDRGGNKQ